MGARCGTWWYPVYTLRVLINPNFRFLEVFHLKITDYFVKKAYSFVKNHEIHRNSSKIMKFIGFVSSNGHKCSGSSSLTGLRPVSEMTDTFRTRTDRSAAVVNGDVSNRAIVLKMCSRVVSLIKHCFDSFDDFDISQWGLDDCFDHFDRFDCFSVFVMNLLHFPNQVAESGSKIMKNTEIHWNSLFFMNTLFVRKYCYTAGLSTDLLIKTRKTLKITVLSRVTGERLKINTENHGFWCFFIMKRRYKHGSKSSKTVINLGPNSRE